MGTPTTVPAAVESEVSPQDRLNSATGEELKVWREKGDLPPTADERKSFAGKAESQTAEVETKTEGQPVKGADSATATEKKTQPVSAADSATAKPQKKKSDERFEELFGFLRSEREARERLERELESLRSPKEVAAAKAESQTAKAEDDPEPSELDKNEKGEFKYKTVAELWKAQREWDRKQTRKSVLDEVTASQKAQETTRQATESKKAIDESLKSKFTASRQKHTDFDSVALNPKLPLTVQVEIEGGKPVLKEGGVIQDFIRDSDLGAEVAYYLGQHPEIVESITGIKNTPQGFYYTGKKMKLVDAMRTLVAVEAEVTEDEKSAEEPSAKTEPVKLPPPPPTLSGKKAAASDDAEAALRSGDVSAYIKAMNARDMAARRRA